MAIEQSDAYEDVDTGGSEVPLYRREITEVIYDNKTTRAWIYWYNRSADKQNLIPSGYVMDVIRLENKL